MALQSPRRTYSTLNISIADETLLGMDVTIQTIILMEKLLSVKMVTFCIYSYFC